MKALVKTGFGPGCMELIEREKPAAGDHQVLVKVADAAISPRDLYIQDGEYAHFPPVIMGSQFSGTVEQVGSGVLGWHAGDRVVADDYAVTCGKCVYCLTGRGYFCPDKRTLGVGADGCFASHLTVPARLLHRVPDRLPLRDACLMSCAAVCMHGVIERAGVLPGDTVVIMGCGVHCLITVQLLRIVGAGKIIVCGMPADSEFRIPLAGEFGATEALEYHRVDAIDVVMDMTDGLGADLVVDFLGTQNAAEHGISMIRARGRYCMIGIPQSFEISLPWQRILDRAVTAIFHNGADYMSWERVIGFAADGRLRLAPLITDVFKPDDWKEAFAYARRGEALKILFEIDG